MTNGEIELIALAHGFELKPQADGSMALHPYVFDFARALLAQGLRPVASVKIRDDSTSYRASIYWLDEELPDGAVLYARPALLSSTVTNEKD